MTLDLHRELVTDDTLPEEDRRRCSRLTHGALLALAETFHEFDREAKRRSVRRARACLSRCTATLLIEHGLTLSPPAREWFQRLEHEILPSVGGLARFIDRLGQAR